jgi:hypothetical protein
MTLGIAIPTYSPHLKYLNDILNLLQKSTVKPNQVSISCSSLNEDYNIDYKNYDFEIIFTPTKEIKNPSQNRNIAASKLNTDIISFIDGDDYPHVQRNEFILNSFKNDEVSSLVHDYYKSTHKNDNFLNSIYENMDLKINYVDSIINNYATSKILDLKLHNAHISLRKEVFEKMKYNENEQFKYMEDSLYTRNLVEGGYKISLITNELSQYNKD